MHARVLQSPPVVLSLGLSSRPLAPLAPPSQAGPLCMTGNAGETGRTAAGSEREVLSFLFMVTAQVVPSPRGTREPIAFAPGGVH